jgi:hypothetical protein
VLSSLKKTKIRRKRETARKRCGEGERNEKSTIQEED